MKLLFVIHGLRSGGAEKVLTLLANQLLNLGFEIHILIFNNEKPFYKLEPDIKLKIIHHKKNGNTLFHKIKFFFERILKLRNAFKEINPDIIISFITIMNIYSIIAAKLSRNKIIVSEHTNYKRNEKDWLGFFRKKIYPFANQVVVLTNYDKKKYSTFLNNVQKIQNPLVLTQIHKNVKREQLILGMGSLVKLKGFDNLINAFSKIDKKDWKLIIVGEGPERNNLEILINKLHLENNVFLPGVTKDVEIYYKKASIFVLSSKIEGFPGVLCEAIGYGCAVLSFNCISGPDEIIDNNKNGLLVKAEDMEELSFFLEKLVINEKLRLDLSSHSQEIIKKLDIRTISNLWIDLFKSI
jgi:GalNAc-alpha-(1->4)-GalNAc-alpha-(1->3)-diNAcBac-PP-undecaprenol alpha-1,4-N-acetyl-D-galactosaminyltransferase